MRFKVGDRVVVAAPAGAELSAAAAVYGGRIGTVRAVDSHPLPYPYKVLFDNGVSLAFADDELMHGSEVVFEDEPNFPGPIVATGEADSVNHPSHYTWLPNGLEVIDLTQHFNFVRGNALKYLLRADFKGNTLEDLKKARWYIDYEIRHLEGQAG
ncbi:DUF3310 domain-containing protein [Kitasatospora purpeofusca]|uniref:DUF3310 domain-containing protein n=1 Tax=Kitasatospora purpeofusca TaxID=67352 RepID=UPI00225C1843|nr:DUF3310 domain-containing protein [Kitasatospora purpeofusca]MCX4685455.1 DUF3310 domain-containing protein [Kitasatospora purpeofusca]